MLVRQWPRSGNYGLGLIGFIGFRGRFKASRELTPMNCTSSASFSTALDMDLHTQLHSSQLECCREPICEEETNVLLRDYVRCLFLYSLE